MNGDIRKTEDITIRAGFFVRQPAGYKAFIPKDLPPDPPIKIDQEMWFLLSEADRALGRLDGTTTVLPDPDVFVAMYVKKEAVLSSQIEGTQASLLDVLEFEAGSAEPRKHLDVKEVVNYIAAMDYGLERLKTLPLSLRLIREIHHCLLQGVRGGEQGRGEFRVSQNWVGPVGSTPATAVYVPPPPHEMKEALDHLERFLHEESPMPVLTRVGLVHAHFETIHPFIDGNGRVGRLLITFLLCQQGVLQRPLLYLSHYLKANRSEYYDSLQAIREVGDWEGWLKFFLRGVRLVSEQATFTAKAILDLRERHRRLVSSQMGMGAANALTLIEKLYRHPVISVRLASEITGLSFPNANRLVERFEEIGLLREITGAQRNRRFAYAQYLDLFAEPEENKVG